MASLKDLIVMGPARFLDKLYGNLEGNATSADKLKTARIINGTSFDGSGNITTENWGMARNLSISSAAGVTGTSVNGSTNAVLIVPSDMTDFNSIKVNYLGLGGYEHNTNYQINFSPNKAAMSFRSSLAEYDTYIYYGTAGNEALTFATTNTVTHIQFANGHTLSNFDNTYWNTITPALDIANNNVHIGGIASTDYKFKVTGTSYFSDVMTVAGLFTYTGMQTGTADAARCVWFSDSEAVGRPVYDSTFTYNPVSKEIGTIKRISHPANAALHLGNADNNSWVATQDIRSHSGTEYWAINVAGTAWFKKLNLGYTYDNGGAYLLNVNGNTMLAGTVYLDTAASTYISSTYYTGTSARSNILANNSFTADNIDNVTDNGLHFGTISSYAGPGFSSSDSLILSMSWNTGNSYGAQLAFDDVTTANMYVRNKNTSWSSWEKVLLSNNYTDYTVTKTGTGASGTWDINVTGYSKNISYPAQLTTDDAINAFNAINTFQVATWNGTSTPGVSNGMLISTGWTSTSFGAQIAIDDDPTYYIALRQRNSDGWKAWKRIPMGDGTGASGTWGISITGSAGSVAWGNITGKPSSFTPSAHNHAYLSGWGDTRDTTTTPNDYNAKLAVVGIKTPTGSGTLDGSSYSTLIGIRGWSDSSGGNSHELAFTGNGALYHRHGATTSWNEWKRIPFGDGDGASGTWDINIDGHASSAGYASYVNSSRKHTINSTYTAGRGSRLYFRNYRASSSSDTSASQNSSGYELYYLPSPTPGTSTATYNILTSKSDVTVSQGGTGSGNAGAASGNALYNLGIRYQAEEPAEADRFEGMIWLKPV